AGRRPAGPRRGTRAARRDRLEHQIRVDSRRSSRHVRRGSHHDRLREHQRRRHRIHTVRFGVAVGVRGECRPAGKLTERRAELPGVDKVVVFEGTGDGDWVMTLDDLADLGVKYLSEQPQSVSDAVDGISSDRLATLIYTSGTTGRPKGVRLRHEAWVYAGVA